MHDQVWLHHDFSHDLDPWVSLEGWVTETPRDHEKQDESVICQSSKISMKPETLKEQRKSRKSVEIV